MNISGFFSRLLTKFFRLYLVGPKQHWIFERPPIGWVPTPMKDSSIYLHVPFCRHFCPYCPYIKVPFHESLVEPYTRAAIIEVDQWANAIGLVNISSIYIGGGTPTLALAGISRVLNHIRKRFHFNGDICIETNPSDVNSEIIEQMLDMGVSMVSLGIQSFDSKNLSLLGRGYAPIVAERALSSLASNQFISINVDLMFALPNQITQSLINDLSCTAELGATQITTYPLFTFPYTSVGKLMHLANIRMPRLRVRREQYRAINQWCAQNGYMRASVWSFKHENVPRYSSVTRDGYIGIGPSSGSQLLDGFVFNTFDFNSWMESLFNGHLAISLRMPFTAKMKGWWWLYWRLYDTYIPIDYLETAFGHNASNAFRWLKFIELIGFAVRNGNILSLTETGAFWIHLLQNYFALNYVNKLWTEAGDEPWPKEIVI